MLWLLRQAEALGFKAQPMFQLESAHVSGPVIQNVFICYQFSGNDFCSGCLSDVNRDTRMEQI